MISYRQSFKTTARWIKPMLLVKIGLVVFSLSYVLAGPGLSRAATTPEQDLARVNAFVQQALKQAQAGDITAARASYDNYENAWFDIEPNILAKSKDSYRAIETAMGDVKVAFLGSPVNATELITTLQTLDSLQHKFINAGNTPGTSQPTSPPTGVASIATVITDLNQANTALAAGDFTGAAQAVARFQTGWLDAEGIIKIRSDSDYRQTENDMALAYSLLTQKSVTAKPVLDRMITRLIPYQNSSSYGIWDATIILLREGLEALLVVVALLTFLKKSDNGNKQGYIWAGAGVGLLSSVALAVILQVLFSSAINGGNREILEGSVGLVAAVMLLYVSYWMHSKSSATAWNQYIKSRSTAALAKGSLVGLALLSFLAIFREGAESVLFILGMGSNISLNDLLLGLAIGALALLILGLLLVVAGLRIPMAPFFTIASILVFYLCFKFIGVGVHALQVAKVLPASSATYLPENDFFGLFPTWETTLTQAVLLLIAATVIFYDRFKSKRQVQVATELAASK